MIAALFSMLSFLNVVVGGDMARSSGFERAFTGKTLRVELLHTGNAFADSFEVTRMAMEPVWSGPRTDGVEALERREGPGDPTRFKTRGSVSRRHWFPPPCLIN